MKTRIEKLRAAGAEGYDAPGLTLIRNLVDRAERGAVDSNLEQRAAAMLDAFEAEFHSARDSAVEKLAALEQAGLLADPLLRLAFAVGDFKAAVVAAQEQLGGAGSNFSESKVERLRSLARRQGIEIPEDPEAAAGHAFSKMAAVSSGEAVGRALDEVKAKLPQQAGPYNPLFMSSKVLDELSSLSPTYLRGIVSFFEGLSRLDELPPAPRRKKQKLFQ